MAHRMLALTLTFVLRYVFVSSRCMSGGHVGHGHYRIVHSTTSGSNRARIRNEMSMMAHHPSLQFSFADQLSFLARSACFASLVPDTSAFGASACLTCGGISHLDVFFFQLGLLPTTARIRYAIEG